ncbi:hypothetical protein BJ978_001101 [Agromyces terreus]|uniref:Uncharacterized protein n=1 Tax=Agromyces terreus TaxID=424795 RepID=A0A9X2GWM8_9MICO|nr:hypothetical protein [Agromyces terreus]MCP2370425.1 hypothetical protein [Agromyces terreus]
MRAGMGVIAVGSIVVLIGLTGCADAASTDDRLDRGLRADAADIAREIAGIAGESGLDDPADAIQEYARRALPLLADTGVPEELDEMLDPGSPDYASALRLVGIEASGTESWQEPVGALVLASRTHRFSDDEETTGELCLRVELDRWGPTAGWDDDGAIARVVDCATPSPETVVPEADSRPIIVVPDNAEAVATDVLANAGGASDAADGPTAEAIAAEITARLEAPTGEREVAAQVQVARDGDRIGLAMGTPDDCLLLRADGGRVERLHVSSVQLQPGELGCSASTALASDDALAPPH